MEFSIAAGKRLIGSQGDIRVSEDSAKEFNKILERFAGDIAEEAIRIAREDDRKTLKSEDIRNSLK